MGFINVIIFSFFGVGMAQIYLQWIGITLNLRHTYASKSGN
jgi:hypothetical protein